MICNHYQLLLYELLIQLFYTIYTLICFTQLFDVSTKWKRWVPSSKNLNLHEHVTYLPYIPICFFFKGGFLQNIFRGKNKTHPGYSPQGYWPQAMEAAEEHRPLEIGTKIDAFMTAVNSSSLTALIYSQIIGPTFDTRVFLAPQRGSELWNRKWKSPKISGEIVWLVKYYNLAFDLFCCWDWRAVYVFLVVWAKGRFFPMIFIFVVVVVAVSLSEFWYSRLCLKESDDLLHCSLWEIVYQPVFN